MTIFDKIKEFDMDDMAEFLYRFARDSINQFGNFVMPNKDSIMNFLEKEVPNSD